MGIKIYENPQGSQYKYDPEKIQELRSREGNVIVFSPDQVREFITETGLWDGFYLDLFAKGPFDLQSWIHHLKESAKMTPENLVRLQSFLRKNDYSNSYLTDFDVACKIKDMIMSKSYTSFY